MSGGSFNYLCYKDASDLFGAEDDIESMIRALSEVGYAEDAARETAHLLANIRHARVLISVAQERLSIVWQGMEWWRSADYTEDGFRKTLEAYRAQLKPKESE